MRVPVEADHQFKVPVVRRSEYTLFLEQATRHHTFIHCDVRVPWTRGVKQQLAADWAVLKGLHGGPLFALHDPVDRKHHTFLKLFGFRKVASYQDRRHGPREIFST
jgi:hypothetical protein